VGIICAVLVLPAAAVAMFTGLLFGLVNESGTGGGVGSSLLTLLMGLLFVALPFLCLLGATWGLRRK
jgi:hypothetical protein